MNLSKNILGILLIAIFGFSLMIGTGLLMGTHTKYCPWRHVLLNTESCAVRDQRDGQVLIEHHDNDNLFNANNYLEIRDDSQSYKFRIPGSNLILEDPIKLIPNEHGAILVNGHRQQLTLL
jgi:hypothetical protein